MIYDVNTGDLSEVSMPALGFRCTPVQTLSLMAPSVFSNLFDVNGLLEI